MRQSAAPRQRMFCLTCAGSVQEVCAVHGVPLQLGALSRAEGRHIWAGSVGLLAQLGPLWKKRRRKGQEGKGGRVDWGWQGVSSPAGFKEGVGEGPRDTEKTPVFLMNLHNRNVAEQ